MIIAYAGWHGHCYTLHPINRSKIDTMTYLTHVTGTYDRIDTLWGLNRLDIVEFKRGMDLAYLNRHEKTH